MVDFETLQLSIQTVEENIAILLSQENRDADFYLELKHQFVILYALERLLPNRPIEDGYEGVYPVCPYCGQVIDVTSHQTYNFGDV